MTRIKICGITSLDDALAACSAGADALGFVFADSPRRIPPETARKIVMELPPFVTTVGVFVDQSVDEVRGIMRECALSVAQLHGQEDAGFLSLLGLPCIKAFRVDDDSVLRRIQSFGCKTFLLDACVPDVVGGTGRVFDWSIAQRATKLGHVILAGGLTPDNVAEALSTVRPYAVDLSSGVERAPGDKDQVKMKRFIEKVRRWDYRTSVATSVSLADDLFPKR